MPDSRISNLASLTTPALADLLAIVNDPGGSPDTRKSTLTQFYSLGQIPFPAVQNASADVNTLDDYEEGTWTPVIGGVTSETGQAYTFQVGQYRKIGSFVQVEFYVELSTEGTITGNIQIKGLPFTAASYTAVGPAQSNMFQHQAPTSFVALFASIVSSGVELTIQGITAAATTYQTALTATDIDDNTALTGVITYRTVN